MSLAYGAGYGAHRRRRARRGFAFDDADAAAYVAAMSVEPDNARKAAIDALIAGLKADSLWAGITLLALHAAHDNQAARINAKNPAHVGALAGASGLGPDFLIDNGFKGNGVDASINWGITLAGLGHTLTNAAALIWNSEQGTGNDFGQETVSHIGIAGAAVRAGSSAQITGTAATFEDRLIGFDRSSSTRADLIYNGTSIGNQTVGADNLGGTLHTLRRETGFGTRRIAVTIVRASQSLAQHVKLFNRISAYMEAVQGTPGPL